MTPTPKPDEPTGRAIDRTDMTVTTAYEDRGPLALERDKLGRYEMALKAFRKGIRT